MVTCCGGDPTDRETVRETLWWKATLLGGFGMEQDDIFLALRGRITDCCNCFVDKQGTDCMKVQNIRRRSRIFTESIAMVKGVNLVMSYCSWSRGRNVRDVYGFFYV